MKIALASDLHFEFHRKNWLPEIASNCDVIVLAGDIAVGENVPKVVRNIAHHHPQSYIVLIAGNHEFYKRNLGKQIEFLRETFVADEQIHFLENDRVAINGFDFLGCTLWTGFDLYGADQVLKAMNEAAFAIADFTLIKTGADYKRFLPLDAALRFNESRLWLKTELQNVVPDKTIVVSHFPPCANAQNKFFDKTLLTAYFQANCDELINQYQPALWCYGHNHFSDDFLLGRTRVVSNQLGYPKERFPSGYQPNKLIEL